MKVISPETRMMGLQYGEEIMIVGRTMWTQSTSVTDGRTDRITITKTVQRIASHGKHESCAIAKMTAQCVLYMVPWKFSGLLDYAHCYYSHIFHGLLFWSTIWIFLQNLKSVDLPVPEIIGGTQKIWAVPGYAHALFSPKFLMGFYLDWLCQCTRQIWSP